MTTFMEPPFWAARSGLRTAPHAVSVRVEPAVTLGASTVANPTVLTTALAVPHYLVTGDTVTIAGHAGSAPTINGSWVVIVLSSSTFSVPVNVTGGGTGGTVTRAVPVEPLTLVEAKLRAGLDWSPGDARDGLMTGFISAARSQVEQDTGLALLTQVRDVYLDALSWRAPLALPGQSMPLQSVTSVTSTDTAGAVNTLATGQYVVDLASGRIGLALGGSWPTDVRPFQPIVVRIVAGWTSVSLIPPLLVHAVGLLTAHYATLGRDLALPGTLSETPYGYDAAIAPHQLVSVA